MYNEFINHRLSEAETNSRFLTTFAQAAVGMAHVSASGRLIRVNQKFCEIVGHDANQLLSKTFQDITYPDDLQQDVEAASTLLSGERESYTMEKRYIRADGSITWAMLSVSIVRGQNEPDYFISVISDINARKQSEEVLRKAHLQVEREREFALVERDSFFNLANDCMAISNLTGYFVRANPAFCQVLGYTEREITTRLAYEFMHPDDVERTRKFREGLLLSQKNNFDLFENRYIAKNGEIKWISWTVRSIKGVGNYLTGRDITALKAAEEIGKEQHALMTTNLKLNAIGLMPRTWLMKSTIPSP